MTFNNQEAKSILSSTTFWGSVISLFAILAPHVYGNIAGSADQTAVVSNIVGIVGFAIAVYGRFHATQPVTLTGASKK